MSDYFKALKRYLLSTQPFDKKTKFLFWSLVKYRWVVSFEKKMQQLQLTELLNSQAYLLYMFRMHAFMSKSYRSDNLIKKMALEHFGQVAQKVTPIQLNAIYHQGLVIYEDNLADHVVKLSIQYDERMRFEGLMTLKLWVNDIELYYLHFILSPQGAFIGGVQGSKGHLELNRVLTKITYGLRPQNFVYFGFTKLCAVWQQISIFGIKNDFHVYQNESKSENKVLFDFEAFWQEQGGQSHSEEWVLLPSDYIMKPLEQVVNKKRSTYRKRYALMTEISSEIQNRLKNDGFK